MSFVIGDRVHETSTTTGGTADYELLGAETGMQDFVDGVGDGNTTHYAASDGTDWELGLGTVTSGVPNTLSRDTIINSSNSGSAVVWTAGTRDIVSTILGTQQSQTTVLKTAAFVITAADNKTIFECTNSSYEATLPDGATAGKGFECTIVNANNSGTGYIYAAPAGTDTMFGSFSAVAKIYAGQSVIMRLRDSEDDWDIVADSTRLTRDFPVVSGVRTVKTLAGLLTSSNVDVDNGAIGRTATPPAPMMESDDSWIVDLVNSNSITFQNKTGVTCRYVYTKNTVLTSFGSVNNDALVTVTGLATGDIFYFQAQRDTSAGYAGITFHGFVTTDYFTGQWIIDRGFAV